MPTDVSAAPVARSARPLASLPEGGIGCKPPAVFIEAMQSPAARRTRTR
ncbi:MAG: hypothetical protein ABSF26_12380 [Thermoguttaceae bacterium]